MEYFFPTDVKMEMLRLQKSFLLLESFLKGFKLSSPNFQSRFSALLRMRRPQPQEDRLLEMLAVDVVGPADGELVADWNPGGEELTDYGTADVEN